MLLQRYSNRILLLVCCAISSVCAAPSSAVIGNELSGGLARESRQLIPDEKGTCFALGSGGPCSSTQLLGYDIFKRQLQCVVDPFSPESSPSQQNELVDGAENKELFSQDYISERIGWIEYLISISLSQRRSDSGSGGSLPPMPPLVTCPADSFLTASGSCVDDSRAAKCGPSTRFNEATGQYCTPENRMRCVEDNICQSQNQLLPAPPPPANCNNNNNLPNNNYMGADMANMPPPPPGFIINPPVMAAAAPQQQQQMSHQQRINYSNASTPLPHVLVTSDTNF
ncbi:hypothetical protein DAPPUDRAFT_253505 [Daphnia pulex]|uniref:Uncharacterized protein n=1 Tax=Daphnia pulex TaxID=6669 RepID=E9H503_DAPPU|nr:hypothetical protein DAPPUDRAFT_253505 [Daphnia pulex]|eukprot:EFX73268.1 hypothetical protein DAPPUDRAFT_253505 [Daphnia pulex]